MNSHISGQADLVTFWWDRASDLLTRAGTSLKRFGLVTTNSITQQFSRRVVQYHLRKSDPCSIVWAVDDHPWYRAQPDVAQVRIAMTVVVRGAHSGFLNTVISESMLETDDPLIIFATNIGTINSDLTIGADVTLMTKLAANNLVIIPLKHVH